MHLLRYLLQVVGFGLVLAVLLPYCVFTVLRGTPSPAATTPTPLLQ